MYRSAVCLVILLFLGLVFGCGKRESASLPTPPKGMALVTVAEEELKRLPPEDRELLLQVMNWLDHDLRRRLRDRGFEATLLRDMKNYAGTMGPLLVMNIQSFEPGMAANSQHREARGVPSALVVRYRLEDERRGLLDQWQDGAESIKGGTYCARILNRRTVEKVSAAFRER